MSSVAPDPSGRPAFESKLKDVDQQNFKLTVPIVVIDGWGIPTANSLPEGDAIAAAETPFMSGFADENSTTAQGYTELDASSLAVGLPEGLMGNSEVGHLNIGAGRVVWQDVCI